jgi:hypothetical protein
VSESPSAAETFKVALFRSLDASAREFEALRAKVDDLRLGQARDSVKLESAGADAERIRALELAKVEPSRLRSLEEKVTRLDVRSGIIGALGGTLAGAALPPLLRFLFARLAG